MSHSVLLPTASAIRRAALLFAAFGCVSLATPATAHAEGTAQIGDAQVLLADTEILVDIIDDGIEQIVWTGVGRVQVVAPDGMQLGSYASGEAIDPTSGPGTYMLRPVSDQQAGRPWDVGVAGAGAGGRVSSREWFFDAGGFGLSSATSASFYVLIGSPEDGTAVVELRFHGLAGFEYALVANSRGVDGPLAGRSVLADDNSVTPEYRLYLLPPDIADYEATAPEVTAESFRGGPIDCEVFAPGLTVGTLSFNSSAPGTYQLICDTNGDTTYDLIGGTDYVQLGEMRVGLNEIVWDGTAPDGEFIAPGDYECIVRATVGEVHWLGDDIETCFQGVRMFAIDAAGTASPLPLFWDDSLISAAPEAMFDDALSPNRSPEAGLSSGDPDAAADAYDLLTGGNARGWGVFESGSKGNNALMDTFTWLFETTSATIPVGAISATLDTDSDGAVDVIELCQLGTDPESEDSDGGGRSDGSEINEDNTNPLDPTDDIGNDYDNDGLTNEREAVLGTNPADPDTDGDGRNDGDEVDGTPPTDPFRGDTDDGGRSDGEEIEDGTDPTNPTDDLGNDFDGDGLSNEREAVIGTNPANPDTDGDGRNDGDEVDGTPPTDPFRGDSDDGGRSDGEEIGDGTDPTNPTDDLGNDFDRDGLSNEREAVLGTDPGNPDTDGDGRTDGEEVDGDPTTDPFIADSDDGGRNDGDELDQGTDPNDPTDDLGFDFDNDGLTNDAEAVLGTDPTNADTDNDGVSDGDEVNGTPPTDPFEADSDNGGAEDGEELNVGTNPTDPSDDHGFDFDLDGRTNEIELSAGTDPNNPDTDGDGLCDGGLDVGGVCVTGEDKNNNGVVDSNETDPLDPDTDKDGVSDGDEVAMGLNPLDPDSDDDGQCDGPVELDVCGRTPFQVSGGSGFGCAAAPSGPSPAGPLGVLLAVALLRRRR